MKHLFKDASFIIKTGYSQMSEAGQVAGRLQV